MCMKCFGEKLKDKDFYKSQLDFQKPFENETIALEPEVSILLYY